jgi:hypothetical protein
MCLYQCRQMCGCVQVKDKGGSGGGPSRKQSEVEVGGRI